MRLDDGVCSLWFAVEHGLHQRCVLGSSLLNVCIVAFIVVAYTRFKAGKDIMAALVATTGELALVTMLWGMLYADETGVVSQPPE